MTRTRQDQAADKPLSHHVRESLNDYFRSLNGCQPPCGLYRMVLEQVEKPLLERVLDYSEGNQSRAAELLGINRGTLRKKLKQYQLDF
ncbi:DNA-binding protein Fis [Salinisphaera sp. PC39]|uniref:DNA-binding transcriptional regulator Fis n=1 Tax=Salinisphaera sp. PC39 TaxID=1304156 RepID=UPI00334097A3